MSSRRVAPGTTCWRVSPVSTRSAAQLSRDQAVDHLRDLALATVFQPERAEAPIQIMGVLEAAGMSFDALWVSGLTAEAWPAAARPNPYLPVRWQRQHALPRSSPERELEYARALTAQFATAAPQVVFSSATRSGEQALQSSALIDAYALSAASLAPASVPGARVCRPDRAFARARDHRRRVGAARLLRERGSWRLASARCSGGLSLPGFRGFPPPTEPWPALTEGLSYKERGTLAHSAMAASGAACTTRRICSG